MKVLVKRLGASRALTRLGVARARRGALVLNYHDLAPDGAPGSWLRVPQSAFDRQLSLLRGIGDFVAPDALFAPAPRAGRLRLLLTFDDGYVNNLRLALPVLRRHGVPALFFVSTRHVATQEPFWFDRVVAPIQGGGLDRLDLRDAGLADYRFRAGDGPGRWEDIQRVLEAVKGLGNPGDARVDRVLALCAAAGGEAAARALADCRPLRPAELREMQGSGLCSFGSHAHRHEILTVLDDAALAASLAESLAFLDGTLGGAPRELAYPNGDTDARVAAAARRLGFRRGYTTRPGVARPDDDQLRLPRLLVGGFDSPTILFWNLNRALLAGRARR